MFNEQHLACIGTGIVTGMSDSLAFHVLMMASLALLHATDRGHFIDRL